VDEVTPRENPMSDCSNFNAVMNANKPSKEKNLHTSGLVNAVCRHGIGLKTGQLKYGEKYGYGLYMLLSVCGLWGKEKDERKVVGWLYDISCQFEKYLRNLLQRHDLIAELKSAVAELLRMPHGIGECHVLGHKIECQLFKSARVQLGLGLTDGEQPERLHAVLVRYANQLKYSSPEKFKFTLDYVLAWHAHRKHDSLGHSLASRRLAAEELYNYISVCMFDLALGSIYMCNLIVFLVFVLCIYLNVGSSSVARKPLAVSTNFPATSSEMKKPEESWRHGRLCGSQTTERSIPTANFLSVPPSLSRVSFCQRLQV
jgi:hypothetical protein